MLHRLALVRLMKNEATASDIREPLSMKASSWFNSFTRNLSHPGIQTTGDLWLIRRLQSHWTLQHHSHGNCISERQRLCDRSAYFSTNCRNEEECLCLAYLASASEGDFGHTTYEIIIWTLPSATITLFSSCSFCTNTRKESVIWSYHSEVHW